MIIDLHNHSSKSRNTTLTFSNYHDVLKNRHDIGIGITDHNKLGDESTVASNIFNGIEVLNGYGDFLVYGVSEECIELRHDMIALIDYVHGNNGIIIAAHPFTGYGICNVLSKNDYKPIIQRVDAIESLNGLCTLKSNKLSEELAFHYGKPCTGGSDAHHENQLLTCGTKFNTQILSIEHLIEVIKSGDCKPVKLS